MVVELVGGALQCVREAAAPSLPAANAAIRSLGASWARVLAHLERMQVQRQEPDQHSQNQLLAAAQSAGAWRFALALLKGPEQDPFAEARRAAKLYQLGGPVPMSEVAAMEGRSLPELAAVLWSLAAVASDEALLLQVQKEICSRILGGQVRTLETPSLGNVAWALATKPPRDRRLNEVMAQILRELLGRSTTLPRQAPPSAFVVMAEAVLATLWAGHVLELGIGGGAQVGEVLRSLGRALDAGSCTRNILPSLPTVTEEAPSSLPRNVWSFRDGMVLLKPDGWQIYDKVEVASDPGGPRLRGNFSAFWGSQWPRRRHPLPADLSCNCGFLHRLDVPSSGLILAASSYQMYYELRRQLAVGSLHREYAVLSHGWVPGRTEIGAPVRWSSASVARQELTKVTKGGWPAKTYLLARAHLAAEGLALTLLDVRIQTGRRHQIRTHLAHVGFPSLADGKYSADGTYQIDAQWCPRNFLHRYQLRFSVPQACKDVPVSFLEPLPLDLRRALSATAILKLFGAAEDWLRLLQAWKP
ncbi:ylyB [Symbiodinium natans]|uniref:YlyB protein n=1 Tax=Symbiodinium natans TaxID=878477 RepID=A0A812VB29_9DINO|nr:ylyB [Symbiodinium natans]